MAEEAWVCGDCAWVSSPPDSGALETHLSEYPAHVVVVRLKASP